MSINIFVEFENLAAVLESEECCLKDLVVTHWHHDHIGGVPEVVQEGGQWPGCASNGLF